MATAYDTAQHPTRQPHRDARMAFIMAAIMATVIVAGFSLNLAMGRSTFAVPIVYHLHAAVFFSWTVLFVIQTRLAALGSITHHRRLGRIGAALLPLLVVMGLVIMINALRRTGGPFFFAQNEFLWGNLLLLACFAGLVLAALLRRRQTDWHSRYMLTAMAILTGPGFGRLLPMPLLIPWAWQISILVTLVFPLAGMFRDRRRDGRIHPAWLWATGAVLGVHLLSQALAYTPFGIALTEAVVAGTPGAARPLAAFLP
jgi:hypothetical protein